MKLLSKIVKILKNIIKVLKKHKIIVFVCILLILSQLSIIGMVALILIGVTYQFYWVYKNKSFLISLSESIQFSIWGNLLKNYKKGEEPKIKIVRSTKNMKEDDVIPMFRKKKNGTTNKNN